MIIGIPKGLLYVKYYPFVKNFFFELGDEIIESKDTNKDILNLGVKYCVDEACLPIKIFHGHVASIKDECDFMLVPRVMQIHDKEYICPKFCGLPEMIYHSIPNLPQIIDKPIYANSMDKLFGWCWDIGKKLGKDSSTITKAFNNAYTRQKEYKGGINAIDNNKLSVALIGHPYNVYDSYTNMNLIKKLEGMSIGTITQEYVPQEYINNEVKNLYKRPFWTFAREAYGASVYLALNNKVDGIIYISSFSCGIDSVVLELIKDKIKDFPLLVLKLDEHTGEAGLDTRLEAFVDMLERKCIA